MNYSYWLSFCQVPPILNYPGTESIVFSLYRPLPLPSVLLDVYLWPFHCSLECLVERKNYFEKAMKVKLRLAILYLLVVLIKDFMEDVISENWWDQVWTMLCVGLSTYWSFYHQLSWNILSFLTKLFKEIKSPIFLS